MNANDIVIRACRLEDLTGVNAVCCRTGFGGEDIAVTGVFEDCRLFGLLFSEYYVRYEPECAFVAVPRDEPLRVVGYVLGCPQTDRYERRFARRMLPRIAFRAFFVTSWRHPRTLRELMRWARGNPWKEANPAGPDYPAHLHIDLLPAYQRIGIGGRLLGHLESHFRELGVSGIHLITSNYHRKALPFYAKHGYRIVLEKAHEMWSGVEDYRSIVLVKAL